MGDENKGSQQYLALNYVALGTEGNHVMSGILSKSSLHKKFSTIKFGTYSNNFSMCTYIHNSVDAIFADVN